jgi:hypothetical protein
MSGFSLPRAAVAARLRLTHGKPREGHIYLMKRAEQHSGQETALEMLNRAEGFFPFRPSNNGDVLLVAKAQTIMLTVEHTAPIPDPDRLSAAKAARVVVELADGVSVEGVARIELPESHSRLLDYLNASPEPFFALASSEATHLVNRSHVLFARPLE